MNNIAANSDPGVPPGHKAITDLLESDDLPRMVSSLGASFPDAAGYAEDAVYFAVAQYLAKMGEGGDVEKPGTYIYVVARNAMNRTYSRYLQHELSDDDAVSAGSDMSADADDVVSRDTLHYLYGLVDRWESGRMRIVTRLDLEATFAGEPLSQQEMASLAGDILGEDIPWTSIGKTRTRGWRKLRDEIVEAAQDTGINPINGSEIS